MSSLPEIIDQSIRARGLFRRGQKILVAVSGGVDSMVLLYVLHQLAKTNKWSLTVAHLNHRLRGRSSDADERLVARTAKALRLPVVIERADVKRHAKTAHLSLEMAAREARHEFLARTAARLKISSIAVAHHADDQVELFFVRLLRGSGSEGLAGMKWRNLSPFRPAGTKIELIRPLLEQSKLSLREYARERKIKSREDASNRSLDILRNRIRHELLPVLRRKYQPALDKMVLRLMDIVGAESELAVGAAEQRIAISTRRSAEHPLGASLAKPFAQLPLAVQRRVLQLELRRHKIPADFALVERLRSHPGEAVTVSPEITVFRDSNGILQLREPLRIESNSGQRAVKLDDRKGKAVFDNRAVQWQIVRQYTFRIPRPGVGREIFDADKVGSRIVLRHWRPGDRFQPIGMAQSVKLQDLFTNSRVRRAERHELLVATTADNELFWVEGMRISERFKLTSETKQQLIWTWKTF